MKRSTAHLVAGVSGVGLILVLTSLAGIPSAPRAAAQQPGASDKWGLVEVLVVEKDRKIFGEDKRGFYEVKVTRDGYEQNEVRYDNAGNLNVNFKYSWTYSRLPSELAEGQILKLVVQGTAAPLEDRYLSGYAAVGGSGVDVKTGTVSMDGKQYPNKEVPNWNLPAVGRLDWGNYGAARFKNATGEYHVTVPKDTPSIKAPREIKISYYNGNPNTARPIVTYRYERGAKSIESVEPTGPVGPTGPTGPVEPTTSGHPPTFDGVWEDWGANVGAGRGAPPPGTGGTWGKWTFQVNGANATGTLVNMAGKYGPATLSGTITGKTFTGTWKSANARGTITLTRSGDDRTFSGTYTVDSPPGEPAGQVGRPTTAGQQIPAEGMVLVAPELNVARGTQVLVPVRLLRAKDVLNMDFELTYLPEIVAARPEAERGSLVAHISEYKLTRPGLFKFNFAQLSPINNTEGSVAAFRFNANGPVGSRTPLNLSVHTVNDSKGTRLPITAVNGSITIYDPADPNPPGGTSGSRLQPTCSGTGRQTMNDAQCCLKMWVGITAQSLHMDLDKNGVVDSRDAVIVMQNIAQELPR